MQRCGDLRPVPGRGFAEDFARHLRRRGARAHALQATEQLLLSI
jgi:hypothetical protein